MQKIYSLLRNNKQSGPYTLEELLQLNLKQLDLVWIEGKSAGWSYPTEISSLKMYVEEMPKPAPQLASISQTDTVHTTNEILNNTETETKKTTITSAKHIYISLPAGSKITEAALKPAITVEATEEESPEAKLDRKAEELRNKIQAFTENKNQHKAENDLDIKYTRSLDDIKEEYSSWLYQQQKQKKVFSKKSVAIAASLAFLLMAGYFIIPKFLKPKENGAHILSAQEIAASKPALTQEDKPEQPRKTKTVLKTKNPSKKIKNKTTNSISQNNNTNKKRDKVDAYIDSLKTLEQNKKTETVEAVTYEPPSSTNENGSRQSTRRNDEASVKKTATKKETEPIPFTELIKLSESTGTGTPHLSLYNNSNKHINFVAIDVFYYKANKKLPQKKTLYFKDISPKSSAKLFVPQEKNAASVVYQMGLISTDDGLYYAKQ
jgi:hypothetical protein